MSSSSFFLFLTSAAGPRGYRCAIMARRDNRRISRPADALPSEIGVSVARMIPQMFPAIRRRWIYLSRHDHAWAGRNTVFGECGPDSTIARLGRPGQRFGLCGPAATAMAAWRPAYPAK